MSCLETVRELHAAITARMTGRQVQSVGHRGRTLSYSDTSISDMISLYRQLWAQCPEAQAELPNLQPLDAHVSTTPRQPGRYAGRATT